MDRFIGLDAHSQSCTFAVVDQKGKRLRSAVVETNGKALVEFMKLIPGRRCLCFEEGTQSQWLYELLAPHVDDLAVVRALKRPGNKSDVSDAFNLAERMRTGALGQRIYKAPRALARLRSLAATYSMLTGDLVRTKNRIKSMYRARGIATGARTDVYKPDQRKETLRLLPPAARDAAALLGEQLDHIEAVRSKAKVALIAEGRKHKEVALLRTAPGIGPLRAAQLLAVVMSPHRFRTSRQFWAYCGLAVVTRSSSDWEMNGNGQWNRSVSNKTRGLNRNRNPVCKAIFKDAAMAVTARMRTSALYADYERLLSQGTKPPLARVTLARKIAATTLSMWKKGELYDPGRRRTNA